MRLIDADALTKEAGKLWSEMPDGVELSKDLMKAINHAPTVATDTHVLGKWVSVKDRLPEEAGIYIICDHYGNVMSRHFCKSHGKFAGYWHFNGSCKYGNPLYWMPLPEPPEEVSGDAD